MGHDLILLGSSAGGVDALCGLCRDLKADLPAAILVVQHVAPTARSLLPEILSRCGALPALRAHEGDEILPGRIYVAPPDHHLLVNRDDHRLMLRRGPQENRTRPAIDPLFRSAAVAFGPRVIGVVLSGLLDDGTAGLVAVKACGGLSVVQDPDDAAWPDMPRNALRGDSPDHCVPLADMAALLDRLARSPAGPARPVPPRIAMEARIAEKEIADMAGETEQLGPPSRMSCPQCGGVLNEIEDPKTTRFRCQIGHAYGPESLAASQADALEEALATAVRTHHERQVLFRRMEDAARGRGMMLAAARWDRAAREAGQAATLIQTAAEILRKSAAEEEEAEAAAGPAEPA
ncbi:chemotaxis protein CheB [Paracraurococcus lichenis]|uniref:protein-glutamate methylesterase n=1 Tax=Paracraurococcus lichenis TaxID=3064888 RepID=A0ABT9E3G4_9PROT|nr:chemotaxis protein CheB [Paracraurococcus sp. LOR1-02]MDO9710688.1 chemotaxis protein CheB [Paracraurococcus sp. LOR1-02]